MMAERVNNADISEQTMTASWLVQLARTLYHCCKQMRCTLTEHLPLLKTDAKQTGTAIVDYNIAVICINMLKYCVSYIVG